MSRRSFLRIGALGMGGLALPAILRAATKDQPETSHKSVIMVYLPGGPSHIDTVDLKSHAPAEIRGEFQPIKTTVPGIEVCEHLPRLAAVMDKLIVIRSIVGGVDDHASHMCFTGHARMEPQPSGRWPNFSSSVAKLRGPTNPSVPPFVGLAAKMIHPPYNDPGAGFLGPEYSAFQPDSEGLANMVLHGITLQRLAERRQLLRTMDRLRRDLDNSGQIQALDAFTQQALDVITSPQLTNALDISRENKQTRDLYGPGDPSLVEGFNAAPKMTEHLLIARRLVEAGVRCVTLAFGAWDWHERNFPGHRQELPLLDRGLAALVTDLHERGLDEDVLVVVWGEFGRTPKINKAAGRDHWPGVSCALLAGGGLRRGQVIGATTRLGESVKERPVHFQHVHATIYHHLGINTQRVKLPDLAGRPQYLLERHEPLREVI